MRTTKKRVMWSNLQTNRTYWAVKRYFLIEKKVISLNLQTKQTNKQKKKKQKKKKRIEHIELWKDHSLI